MMLFYCLLLGFTATAFLLSFILHLGTVASFILGFLMLVPMYLIYRERLRHPRIRTSKPRRRIRISGDRGKVLPFPDSGRKTNHMD